MKIRSAYDVVTKTQSYNVTFSQVSLINRGIDCSNLLSFDLYIAIDRLINQTFETRGLPLVNVDKLRVEIIEQELCYVCSVSKCNPE
jgi:hypothetical protein